MLSSGGECFQPDRDHGRLRCLRSSCWGCWRCSTRRSGLTGIVRTYLSYKKTRADLANLKSLAESSDDPEMRQLASAELGETQAKLSKLEEDLKALLIPKDPNRRALSSRNCSRYSAAAM